jgi:hypothetical protein
MIVSEQFVEKVESIVTDEPLVLCVHEAVPVLFGEPAEDVVVLGVELNIIFVQILKKIICAQDFRYLHQLIRIAIAVEKGFLSEDHRRKHGSEGPHVQRIVVFLKVDKELRAFEVP